METGKFWPKTILPSPYGSRVKEVKIMNNYLNTTKSQQQQQQQQNALKCKISHTI